MSNGERAMTNNQRLIAYSYCHSRESGNPELEPPNAKIAIAAKVPPARSLFCIDVVKKLLLSICGIYVPPSVTLHLFQ